MTGPEDIIGAETGKGIEWLEGDRKLLKGIQGLFVKNVPSQMEKLRDAIAAKDTSQIELLSHSIKGAASMVGALPLKDEAGEVEQAAMGGDIETVLIHFEGMSGELAKVLNLLTGTEAG
jgi:HPt (histidine-containing phosphotransfer) domain-containing protein